ncbi:MAG: Spy/CpxP family protein refolding chaperone [Acidobacteria bacterium]|nr:Spy/CpxP family protein refolding chaperone [Acidobacteriota bacterium]
MIRRIHLPTLSVMATLAILGGTVLAGSVMAAQGPGPGGMRGHAPGGPGGAGGPGGRGAGMALGALDLTEAQREQVRQLTQQHRAQTRALAERVRAAEEAQREAMEASPFNEQQVRVAAQAFAEAQTDMAVQQARLRSDIHALLTPDQQQQLERMQAEREARQNERRERMQQRRQGQQNP